MAAGPLVVAASLACVLAGSVALAAGPGGIDDVIAFHQRQVARDPDDSIAHVRLASAYVQKARESGDVTYHDLADRTLQRALHLTPAGPVAARATTLLASVRLARHEFRDALRLAERAAADDPSAQAVVGDAHLELGDIEQAARAYDRLRDLAGPRHPHGRLAALQFLRGDVRGSIEHMQEAVRASRSGGAPREHVAWAQAQLADLHFHAGDLVQADAEATAALATDPGSHRARAMLARVRAGQQRFGEAADLYGRALAVVPLPEYAAALGDVLTRLGRHAEARRQYDLVEHIAALSRIGKVIHNRELALFYADRGVKLPEALALAERELEVRRDVYTFDVLAWARLKNGQVPEAVAAMQEALRLGTLDARLLFHAGMIYRAAGDTMRAAGYLRRALAINAQFHVLQAEVAARTLAELGQP
jgi:tetratricopeptide (TPR) repeat protein